MSSFDYLSKQQLTRGFILLGIYLIFRVTTAQFFPFSEILANLFRSESILVTISVLCGLFVIGTVGLTYLGLRYWVGVDIKGLFSRKKDSKIRPLNIHSSTPLDKQKKQPHRIGDMIWMTGSVLVIFVINLVILALYVSFEVIPPEEPTEALVSTWWIPLGVSFLVGFLIIAPQEEIFFRGFLQSVLGKKIGVINGLFLQALTYGLFYLGVYPLDQFYLALLSFLHALVWGTLTAYRKNLLPSYLSHTITW